MILPTIRFFLTRASISLCLILPLSIFPSPQSLDLGDIASVAIQGISTSNYFGQHVIQAGDLNGDTTQDLIIGSSFFDSQAGVIHIFESISLLEAALTTANADIAINGPAANSLFGKFMSSAGDIDGDSITDLIISSPAQDLIQIYLGKDYATWATAPSLELQSATLVNTGETNITTFLSNRGDLNGDSFDDVIIGASLGGTNDSQTGIIYLFFGKDDLSELSGLTLDESSSADVMFIGTDTNDHSGYSVDIAPDLNGDGYDDLLIGAYTPGSGIGKKVYLIYGTGDNFLDSVSGNRFDLRDADAIFYSQTDGADGFGETVFGLGDINGDGFGDFAVGAPKATNSVGAVYIYFGSNSPYSSTSNSSNDYSMKIEGTIQNNQFGLHAISSAGDINGDMIQDLLIGEFWDSSIATNAGRAFIILGSSDLSTGNISVSDLATYEITTSDLSAGLGYTVASLGDINDDGLDEFILGNNGALDTKGQASIISLASNITPNVSTSTLSFYTDATFTTPLTSAQNLDSIYIELTATDPDADIANTVKMIAYSTAFPTPMVFTLQDTPSRSGVFRGYIQLTRTRNSNRSRQVGVALNGSLIVAPFDAIDRTQSLSVTNAPPEIPELAIEQVGTGDNTVVYINYTAKDLDQQQGTVAISATQVEYSDDNGDTWTQATLAGTLSSITMTDQGKEHNSTFEALRWNILENTGITDNTYLLRMKLYDGVSFSDEYATSNSLHVDNLAPDAPVLSALDDKYATEITVTGEAEAGTTVYIYVNDILSGSGTVDGTGVFSIFPISVSTTENSITAIVTDAIGFSSPSSDEVIVTFANYTNTYSDSNISVTLELPLNSVTNDVTIELSELVTADVTPTVPSQYKFSTVFTLAPSGTDSVTLSEPATMSITLSTPLSTIDEALVQRLSDDGTSWTSSEITVLSLSTTDIVITTTRLGTFMVAELEDPNFPEISTLFINDSALINYHYYPSDITVSFSVTDNDTGIASWSITITDTSSEEITALITDTGIEGTSSLAISQAIPAILADGTYELSARVWDHSDNLTTNTGYFNVNENTLEFWVLHAPNPFNPDQEPLIVGYNTSIDADTISIHILNKQGRIMHTALLNDDDTTAGYHAYQWDGKDRTSSTVPNGIYYGYVTAKANGQETTTKLKIAVLR